MPQSRKKKNKKHKNNATKGKTKTKDNLDNFQPVVSSWFSAGLSSFDHVLACLLQEGNTLENKISFPKECTDFSNETRGKNAEMNSYFNRACLNENFKKYDDVIVYSKKCIGIAERIGDQRVAMMSFLMLGRAYRELNQSDDAIVYSKKCIDIAKEIDEKGIEMTACFVVGKLYFSQSKYKEAVLYSERSLQNAKATGDKRYEAMVYLLLQDCQQHLEQYDDSILTGQKCIAVANEIGDTLGEINAYTIMGNTYQLLNQNDDATGCIIKGLNIAKKSGDRVLEMNSLFSLGKMYHSQDQYNNAVLNMKKTLNIAMETGSRSKEMYACMALGDIYLALHQPENSLDCLQKCLHIAKETGNKHAEGDAYVLLGKTYDALHRENTAVLHLKKGIKIVKEIGIKDHEMDAYFLLGKVYKSSKQYSDAIESFKKSIIIAWEIENKNMQKDVYFQIGNIYECMNQYDKAISYGKKYMEVAKEVGAEADVMEAYLALGVSYLGLDQYDNTFFNLSEGLKLAEKREDAHAIESFQHFLSRFYSRVGMPGKLAGSEVSKGFLTGMLWITDHDDREEVSKEDSKQNDEKNERELLLEQYIHHRSNDDYEQAIECLRKFMDLFELCPRFHSFEKVSCLIEIAEMHNNLLQFENSLKCYQQGIAIALRVSARHLQAECYFQQGTIYFRLGQMKQAEDSYRESIQCFEIMFDDVGHDDEFKISLLDTYSHCYKNLVSTLIYTKQLEEALVVSDQSRARSLKDLFVNFGMEKETSKRQDLHYSDVESLVLNSKFSIIYYSVCCEMVSTAYTFIIDCGGEVHFIIKRLKSFGQWVSFEDSIDQALDEMTVRNVDNCENRSLDTERNEANKSLRLEQGEEKYLIKNIENANLSTEKCRCNCDLNEKSSNNDDIDTGSALERLYQKLLRHDRMYSCKRDQMAKSIKYYGMQDDIVIIPDGPLYKIPFAALRDPDTGLYLSETKRIRLAPSLETLKLLQERPTDYYSKKGTLIVGDPLVGKVMFNGQEREFPPLQNAFCEALAVGSALHATPLTREKATKPAVIKKLQQGVSVVHIAAHGSLTRGRIALAPSPEIRASKIPDEEDYMLTVADVQKAQVRAQLVVLSCCHSGRGEIRAEGVVGMCRAFLASGARAVVASLWAIDDEASLEFMTRFYQNMRERKLSASASLQQAMKEMRNTTNYSEAKYWAPFFLMGDDVTLRY